MSGNPAQFDDFSGGLIDGVDPSKIPPSAASETENIDISDLTLAKRRGSIKVNHTANPKPGLFFNKERDGWGFVAHEADQLPTADFTIEFWAAPSGFIASGWDTVIYKGASGMTAAIGTAALGTTDVYAIYFEDDGTNEVAFEYVLQTGPTVVKWRTNGQDFSTDTPVHIAWHRDSGSTTARCIVDGVSVSVTNVVGTDNGSNLVQGTMPTVIGSASDVSLGRVDPTDTANHRLYRGRLDEIRIWNDVRSAAEVLARKDRELTSDDVSSDLLSYWKCNNGSLFAVPMDSLATATAEIVLHPRRPTFVDGLFNEAPGFKAIQLDGYQQWLEVDIGASEDSNSVPGDNKKPGLRMYDLIFNNTRDNNEQAAAIGQYTYETTTAGTNNRARWTVEIAFKFESLSVSDDNWIFFWEAKRGNASHLSILKIFVDSTGDLRIQVSGTNAAASTNETYDIPDADWVGGARPVITAGTSYMVSVVRVEETLLAYIHNLANPQTEANTTAGGNTSAFSANVRYGPGTDATWETGGVEGVANNPIIGANSIDPGASTTLYSAITVQELRIWGENRASNKTAGTFDSIFMFNHEPLNPSEHTERTMNFAVIDGLGSPNTSANQTIKSPLVGYWPMSEDWRDYNLNNRIGSQDIGNLTIPVPHSGGASLEDVQACSGHHIVLHPQTHTPVFGKGMVDGETQKAAVDGIFNFVQTDGTQELLILSGCQANRLDLSAGLPGALTEVVASGVPSGRLHSFSKFANTVVAGEGVIRNLKFDEDRALVEIMGVAQPEVQPQIMGRYVGGAGEETGDVAYRYTYFASGSGVESAPSQPSGVLRQTSDYRVLVRVARPRQQQLSGNLDAQADRIRIYRTYHGNTSGVTATGTGTFHFVKEIGLPANASHYTDYEDDVPDTSLGLALEFDPETGDFLFGFPPPMAYMVTHSGRIYGAGDVQAPNRLYFSESLKPEVFPSLNNIDLEGSIGQIISGLVSHLGNLYVFTPSSTWVLVGSDPVNFQLLQIDSQIGCVSHHSLQVIDNFIYLAARRGPYRFDGARFEFLGDPIVGRTGSTWEALATGNLGVSTSAFLRRQGLYVLGVSRSDRTI